jgi:hypothetical protein
MLTTRAALPGDLTEARGLSVESSVSAVSWRAVLGGAVAAAAISVVLVLLGLGFGFAAISPWPNAGVTATSFTIAGGIWLIVVQWLSSGVGGFITGRLRTKWVNVHTHEVFFRDTAHGFLTWAVAVLLGAFIVASAVSSGAGTATRAVGSAASAAAQGTARAYDVDTLYRGEKPELASSSQQADLEATRILARGMGNGGVSDTDKAYLVDQVAARTGLSHDDAAKRVDDVLAQEKAAETKARQVADAARKSASAVSIFTALSMLIGAFIACCAAAYGGSLRDEHP